VRGNEDLNKEWREANERVRAAEHRLAGAWAQYTEGKGLPPGPEFMAEVQQLRRECDIELAGLIKRMIARRKSRTERPQG
jgi:hypothetical protein